MQRHFLPLFYGFGSFQRLFWGNSDFPLSEQGLDETSDAATSNWNVFDAGANYITLCDRNDVRHTISGINDDAGQSAFSNRASCPTGRQGKNSLKANVI